MSANITSRRSLNIGRLVLSLIASAVIVPALAQAKTYRVTIDTRALAAQPAPPGPFSLELQLVDGGGQQSNTVIVRNISFGTGGGVAGIGTTTGGASGDLSSSVTLIDTSFLNEFVQRFTPSSQDPLSFTVDISENLEPVTPDSFSVGILDSSANGLSTTFFDAFMQIDITATPTPVAYATDPNTPPPGCPNCAPISLPAPTAQVVAPTCDMVASNDFAVYRGPIVKLRDHSSFIYLQLVTVTNVSRKTIDGPIKLALDGLPAGVTAIHPDGVTTCAAPARSPLFNVYARKLRPRETAFLTLSFRKTGNQSITYTPRVLLENSQPH